MPPAAISAARKWLHKTATKRAAIRNKSLSPTKQAKKVVVEEPKLISEVVDWSYIVECYYDSFGGAGQENKKKEIVKIE